MRKSTLIKLVLMNSLLVPACTSNDDAGEDSQPAARGRRRGYVVYPIHTGGGFIRSAPAAPRGVFRSGSVSRGGFGGKFSSSS